MVTGGCLFSAAQDFLVGLAPLPVNNGDGNGALVIIVSLTSPRPLFAHFEAPRLLFDGSSFRSRETGGGAGAGRSGYFA